MKLSLWIHGSTARRWKNVCKNIGWLVLQARNMTQLDTPPFASCLVSRDTIEEALKKSKITFVQECVFDQVEAKQRTLAELDRLLDPSTYIPWDLLVKKCRHKHRIVIGHPAIPHSHSFMEIYGKHPEWAAFCKEWYAMVGGFDVIVLQKTIPGHILNSFIKINLQHAWKLLEEGVCL